MEKFLGEISVRGRKWRKDMELHPLQDAPSFCWGKGFIQGGRRGHVSIVLANANIFGVGIDTEEYRLCQTQSGLATV
jgi:hypothetical protein